MMAVRHRPSVRVSSPGLGMLERPRDMCGIGGFTT